MVKNSLCQIYQQAVNYAPYSFFYINTNSKGVNKMFYIDFEQRFEVSDD